jgi:hypothetical protein
MARRRDKALDEHGAGDEARGAESNRAGEAAGLPSRHEHRGRRVAPAEAGILTVHVPLTFARSGGRRRMLAPDGQLVVPAPRTAAPANTPVVRALARAFRWRRMIEAGEYATVREIAEAESVNASYVSRVLRLTLLAPRLVEGLAEPQEAKRELTVEMLLEPFSVGWQEQMRVFAKLAT